MSTVDKEMNMEAIFAIMNTIQVVVKIRFKIKLKSLLSVIVFGKFVMWNLISAKNECPHVSFYWNDNTWLNER